MKDTYCSFCGTKHVQTTYPRTCPNGACKKEIWANPIPVSIVLVPVRHEGANGLLVIRRGIEPAKGKLALVGGFLEEHETWQAGGAREVLEETGVVIDAGSVTPFWFTSTAPKPNRVLLFGTCAEVDSKAFAPLPNGHETMERGVVFGPGGLEAVFAFPLHIEAARRYFEARGVADEHRFAAV